MNIHGYGRKIRRITIYAFLGTLMYISKLAMEFLPNVHLIGALIITYTIVYRARAIIPVYVFVFLTGLLSAGFNVWWLPYLYIWTVLWGMAMLIPRKLPTGAAVVVYPVVCALHGLMYGTLYAPVQALAFGYTFEQTIAWISIGFPWDIMHACGNFVAGFLILPLSKLLFKLEGSVKEIS